MFTADDIQRRIHQRPFKPVRILISGGQSYDIYHPDLVMIGRREVTVGTASTDNPTHYEQLSRLAIMHITALEDLPSALAVGNGNGA